MVCKTFPPLFSTERYRAPQLGGQLVMIMNAGISAITRTAGDPARYNTSAVTSEQQVDRIMRIMNCEM